MYDNPAINVGITFMEVFPVGLVVTLVSAGILRRKVGVAESWDGQHVSASWSEKWSKGQAAIRSWT
jgi:hypothetical protein